MLFNFKPFHLLANCPTETAAPSRAGGSSLNEIDRIVCLLALQYAQYRNLERRLRQGAN